MDRFEYLPNLQPEDIIYGKPYDPSLSEPKAKFNVNREGKWIVVIFQDTMLGKKQVLAAHYEKSRKAIKQWIKDYMLNKRYLGSKGFSFKHDQPDKSKMH